MTDDNVDYVDYVFQCDRDMAERRMNGPMSTADTFDDSHLDDDPQPRKVRSEYLGRLVPADLADADDFADFVPAADRGRSTTAAHLSEWDRKRTPGDRERINRLFNSLPTGGDPCPAVVKARDRQHHDNGKPVGDMARLVSLLRLAEQGHKGARDAATDHAMTWRHRTARDSERVIEYALTYIERDGPTPDHKKGCCWPLPEEPPDDEWPPYEPEYDEWPPSTATTDGHNGRAEDVDEPADSWAPLDLGPWLRGEVEQLKPTVGLRRSDGVQLLYPGLEHACIGEMECGKSWFALGHAAAEILAGRRVVYIHFEEPSPADTLARLRALGLSPAEILANLEFIAPARPVLPHDVERLTAAAPALVVLDGQNEGMALHGLDIMKPDGVAGWRRRLVAPFTRAGAAVLQLDHVVKDPERNGGGYALGSVHKGNGINGALFVMENIEPFGKGRRGASAVYVSKDRPGELRQLGKPTKVSRKFLLGVLAVDDSQEYSPNLSVRFFAPSDDEAAPAAAGTTATINEVEQHVLDTIAGIITAGHDPTVRRIRAAADFRAASIDRALERLVLDGRLTEHEGKRGARIFTPTVSHDQKESDE